jgi:hypothetical protein
MPIARPTVSDKPKRRPIREKISGFWLFIQLKIHLLWILFHVWLANKSTKVALERGRTLDRRRDAKAMDGQVIVTHRKLVMIGDDFALGAGDWLTMVSSKPGLLRAVRWPLPGQFIPWHTFISASLGATSATWLPASADKLETLHLTTKKLPLFERAFHPECGEHRDADVVILCVGAFDVCSAEATAANVVAICRALAGRGHRVLVTLPVMNFHARKHPDPSVKARLLARSTAVDAAIRAMWPDQGSHTAAVWVAPRLDHVLVGSQQWRFGGRYPNSKGYKDWSRAWEDTLMCATRVIEAPIYRQLGERRELSS